MLVFWGKALLHGEHKRYCAMERYKASQVITGYVGYAHYQAQKGIMDKCVGRKEDSLADSFWGRQDFLFPQTKGSHILHPHASSGDRGHLHMAGVSQCVLV